MQEKSHSINYHILSSIGTKDQKNGVIYIIHFYLLNEVFGLHDLCIGCVLSDRYFLILQNNTFARIG